MLTSISRFGPSLKQATRYKKPMSILTNSNVDSARFDVEFKDIRDIDIFMEGLHDGKHRLYNAQNEHYKDGYPPVPSSIACWFRGHARKEWDLLPLVNRYEESEKKGFNESALVNGFVLQNPAYLSSGQVNINLILSDMQHYSYPTRFLDWTSSIMYATYFASANSDHHDHDGVVWVLNPFRLNAFSSLADRNKGIAMEHYFDTRYRSTQALVDTYDDLVDYLGLLLRSVNKPNTIHNLEALNQFILKLSKEKSVHSISKDRFSIAVDPGHQNNRITAQKGKFTISSGKQYYDRKSSAGLLFPPPISLFRQAQIIEEQTGKACLGSIIIKAENKAKIRHQLDSVHGINNATLMLDMDNHGKVAKEAYIFKREHETSKQFLNEGSMAPLLKK